MIPKYLPACITNEILAIYYPPSPLNSGLEIFLRQEVDVSIRLRNEN